MSLSPSRSRQDAKAFVGPRHSSSSTSRKSDASVRKVARSLKRSASSRRAPSTSGGKLSIGPCCFRSRTAVTRPIPETPGYPSAASPTSASRSGINSGPTPYFSRTPFSSRIFFPLRSTCTTRPPRTHCARSLSGVQMLIFSTRLLFDARCAAEASPSSASRSVMGQIATPRAASASSRGWNCAHRAGSMPSPVL